MKDKEARRDISAIQTKLNELEANHHNIVKRVTGLECDAIQTPPLSGQRKFEICDANGKKHVIEAARFNYMERNIVWFYDSSKSANPIASFDSPRYIKEIA